MADFKILTKVGEGTFGQVFKAVDLVSKDIVALKRAKISGFDEGVPKDAFGEIEAHSITAEYPGIVNLLEFFID